MKTYFWDFYGPRSEPTARHFEKHLIEFLDKNGCTGASTGLVSEGAGHNAAFCRTPAEWETAIEQALRPKRAKDD